MPQVESDVSLGEVIRLQHASAKSLEDLSLDVRGLRLDVQARPTAEQVQERINTAQVLQAAKDAAQDLALKALQEDLVEFKTSYTSWATWGNRLVLGAVSLGVLGVVIVRPG